MILQHIATAWSTRAQRLRSASVCADAFLIYAPGNSATTGENVYANARRSRSLIAVVPERVCECACVCVCSRCVVGLLSRAHDVIYE